jgi:hypothetical protein
LPVKIQQGVVRTIDGSALPEARYAVLVILPSSTSLADDEAWRQPFEDFFATVASQSFPGFDDITDDNLNKLIHDARQS